MRWIFFLPLLISLSLHAGWRWEKMETSSIVPPIHEEGDNPSSGSDSFHVVYNPLDQKIHLTFQRDKTRRSEEWTFDGY